jgi:2-polyprenyl-3-methyl-5-hydroxy-6-metoxy-1,4-benzoquinol methylase
VPSDHRETGSSPQQLIQEGQYYLPYHYIPRRLDGQIVYAARVDWAAEYLKSIELVAAVIARTRAGRILDIGCGDGRLINELAGRFRDRSFTGVDYSQRAIALAELYREYDNVRFISGNLSNSGLLRTDSYDLVTLIEVLEHIPMQEAEDFVRRVFSMVRCGGMLLVTVPHANKPLQRKHFQHFTGESLRRTLIGATSALDSALDMQFLDRRERGLSWLRAKLAKNRFFTLEPLFQAELRRRSALEFVDETQCGRIVAQLRRG